jgi:hypothetical protein
MINASGSQARAGFVVAAAAVALVACGGGGGFDDVAEGIACAFANCKNSAELPLQDLAPHIEVSQQATRITGKAGMGYRANLVTVVDLTGGDTFTMVSGAQSVQLQGSSRPNYAYVGSLDGQPTTPTVSIDFQRGGQVYRSTVTLPPQFTLLSPTAPIVVNNSAGQMTADLSIPAGTTGVDAVAVGDCMYSDGISRAVTWAPVASVESAGTTSSSTYRVNTSSLNAAVNPLNLPPSVTATQCDLTLTWRRETKGTVPSAFYGGLIRGVTTQAMALRFNL